MPYNKRRLWFTIVRFSFKRVALSSIKNDLIYDKNIFRKYVRNIFFIFEPTVFDKNIKSIKMEYDDIQISSH